MQQANPDVQFVGIAAKDTENEMLGFVSATGVGIFPNVNDADGSIWASYGIGYQPAFVLIDEAGSMWEFGSLSESGLQDKIDMYL